MLPADCNRCKQAGRGWMARLLRSPSRAATQPEMHISLTVAPHPNPNPNADADANATRPVTAKQPTRLGRIGSNEQPHSIPSSVLQLLLVAVFGACPATPSSELRGLSSGPCPAAACCSRRATLCRPPSPSCRALFRRPANVRGSGISSKQTVPAWDKAGRGA